MPSSTQFTVRRRPRGRRRVQRGGPLDQGGQQRSIRDGELLDRFVEVRLGRRGDAVGTAAEVMMMFR